MSRRIRLSPVELEERRCPADLKVLFDFRFDDFGFFRNHPDRIATLQAAANDVVGRFEDTLQNIPFPAAGNSWKAIFDRPGGVGQQEEVVNLLVPANTIVVYAGARDFLGNDLLSVSSEREATGSAEWSELVYGRGQANATGAAATDFSPWGGSLTFDLFNNWHFGLEPPGNGNEYDLYMVAQNGIMHLLGFGASESFARLSTTGSFTGQNAVESFGAHVPLTSGRYEWEEDTLSNGQRTPMDSDFEDGERVVLTPLDIAAMQDIGWQPVGVSPPPPPVPTPPTIPPTVLPPGYRFAAIGAGEGDGPESEVTFNEAFTLTEVARFSPYESGFTGGTRVATGDFDDDGVEDVVVGPGPGRETDVQIFSGATVGVDPNGALLRNLPAFESSFTGGVFVSAGDLNGDGIPEVAISPDEGGGPRVRVFDGVTFEQIVDFYGIDDPNFRGGARTAIGDLNGDGTGDLIVVAGFGGGPRVAAYDGTTLGALLGPTKLFDDFFVFEESLRNGVYVAAGDLDGDGSADLIAGGGPGGGPRVYALSGKDLTTDETQTQVANFFAGDEENRGGVRVAVEDADSDGRADLLAGAGEDSQPLVTAYLGSQIPTNGTPPVYLQYRIFDTDFEGGVYVG